MGEYKVECLKYANGLYITNIRGIASNQKDVIALFDTGATDTVIPITLLKNYSNEKKQSILNKMLNKPNVTTRNFLAASGDIVTGVYCKAEKVNISGKVLDEFYYYLLFCDEKSKKALIGTDFIHYCGFTHSVEGDIHIKTFDYEKYKKQAQLKTNNALNLLEIIKPQITQQDLEANYIHNKIKYERSEQ